MLSRNAVEELRNYETVFMSSEYTIVIQDIKMEDFVDLFIKLKLF